jgi:hypothetical protein
MSNEEPESFRSNEEVKESSYMASIDHKVIELASQNNLSQIKKLFNDESQDINIFNSKDHKEYTSKKYKCFIKFLTRNLVLHHACLNNQIELLRSTVDYVNIFIFPHPKTNH